MNKKGTARPFSDVDPDPARLQAWLLSISKLTTYNYRGLMGQRYEPKTNNLFIQNPFQTIWISGPKRTAFTFISTCIYGVYPKMNKPIFVVLCWLIYAREQQIGNPRIWYTDFPTIWGIHVMDIIVERHFAFRAKIFILYRQWIDFDENKNK